MLDGRGVLLLVFHYNCGLVLLNLKPQRAFAVFYTCLVEKQSHKDIFVCAVHGVGLFDADTYLTGFAVNIATELPLVYAEA